VGSGEPRAEVSLRTSSGDIHVNWLPQSVRDAIPMPPPVPEIPRMPEVPSPVQEPAPTTPTGATRNETDSLVDERQVVLESLSRGEISVDEADALLSSIEARKTYPRG
jgi:hypothetical protein